MLANQLRRLGIIAFQGRVQAHGEGVLPYKAISVSAAVKGVLFEQFSLGQGMDIREFWSRIGCNLSGTVQFD